MQPLAAGPYDVASPEMGDADRFEIQARALANTTKDQMRLMMQSLLAERFQLAVHFEMREIPVLAMTLIKLGNPDPACVHTTLDRHAMCLRASEDKPISGD